MEDFLLGVFIVIIAYLLYTKRIDADAIKKQVVAHISSVEDPLASKRLQILKEIIETERSYNKSLNSLFTNYIEPLQTEKSGGSSPHSSPKSLFGRSGPILTKDEIKTIFLAPSLESIVQLSNTILSKLDDRQKTQKKCFADVFVEVSQFLKCYTTYINGLGNSIQAFRNATKLNKRFKAFIETQRKLPGVDDVDSLMIMPVQRIPRYILLLKELQKATNPNHPDYKNIAEAIQLIEGVASLLNESKKVAENMEQVFKLESILQLEHDVTRKLIKEGSLISTKNKKINCYLFNDRFVAISEQKTVLGKSKINQILTSVDIIEEKPEGFVLKVGRVDIELKYVTPKDRDWYTATKESIDTAKSGRLSIE